MTLGQDARRALRQSIGTSRLADELCDALDRATELAVNVKAYGAVGDGVTDDTTAVQTAVTRSASKTLDFPAGSYKLASAVTVSSPTTIRGLGGTVLCHLPVTGGSSAGKAMVIEDTERVVIDGLTFDGTGAPAGTLAGARYALYVDGCTDVTIRNCRFKSLSRIGTPDHGGVASTLSEYGVYVINSSRVRIEGCDFTDCSGGGIFCQWSDDLWIERNTITLSGPVLYHLGLHRDCSNVWIKNNIFRGGDRYGGGAVNVMSLADADPCRRIWVLDNLFESTDGFGSGNPCCRILSAQTATVRGNTIRDCGGAVLIHVENRSGSDGSQVGPVNVHVESNTLLCGGPEQRGVECNNANTQGIGGLRAIVRGNTLATDGAYEFAGGIRSMDFQDVLIDGNYVKFTTDSDVTNPNGIHVSERAATGAVASLIRVLDNQVDCTGRGKGIEVLGAVARPEVRGNTVRYPTSGQGVVIDAAATDAIDSGNVIVGVPTSMTRLPAGDGHSVGWTANTASAEWSHLDEPANTPDDDETYLAKTASDASQFVTLSPFEIPAGATVNSVTVYHRAKAHAGAYQIRPFLRVDTANYAGSFVNVDAADYQTRSQTWLTNPATDAAWTADEINGDAASGNLTEVGVASSGIAGDDEARLTQMYVVVSYTEP